jgi:hypothetical protein
MATRIGFLAVAAADLPDVDAREAFELRDDLFAEVLPHRRVAKELGNRDRQVVDDRLRHLLVAEQCRQQVDQADDGEELDQLTQATQQRGATVTAEVVTVTLAQGKQQQVGLDLLEFAPACPFQSHFSSSASKWSMSTGLAR